jgi:transformation/transcription domain-associated protein
MDQQLMLFMRDEVLTWYNIHKQNPQVDASFREQVACMAEGVVSRAETLAARDDKDEVCSSSL